ncbi:MAG: excinuclease ABC subunit UvrA [Deltaproteobacteria bacterium]|nr:MAG: excinuclease ABC subunit UvrA [Deltaproteobacteria bacterium]
MGAKVIKVIRARQNNLKGFDLEIPLQKITVVTGVSGSGKSSLAFDTLYAEGQRRYVETFSPYARQFMDRMDRPHVERIEGIPPAIAIEQGDPVKTSRSTVGTMTEITDYAKLLFARMAGLSCRGCDRGVQRDTPQTIFSQFAQLPAEAKMVITFPFRSRGISAEQAASRLAGLGFFRIFRDGEVMPLEGQVEKNQGLQVVVDRMVFRPEERKRCIDSLEQALHFGEGEIAIHILGGETLRFTSRLHCPYCDVSYRDPIPNLFSFNSPMGACENCRGFGRIIDIDLDLVVPDKNKTLRQGAIKPWTGIARLEFEDLMAFCRRRNIPVDIPFKELKEEDKRAVIDGDGGFYGVRGFFRWLETKKYKLHVRVFLARYRSYVTCPTCGGTRFKEEALLWRIKGKNIADVYAMSIGDAQKFFHELSALPGDEVTRLLLREITGRLRYLVEVGLAYLTLDRQSRTLSGGEVERVSLTKALGSSLVNTLYILDEPSIGLHPRDSHRLVQILRDLKQMGNTVVVVEHDQEIITGCDHIVDLGPGAGEKGGDLVYHGPIAGVMEESRSLTGRYLKGDLRIPVPTVRRKPKQGTIRVRGAQEHNLKGIDLEIPLGLMTCITGVSGSGKSTLAEDILYRGLKRAKGAHEERPGAFDEITGAKLISEVILVDQRPIGKSPRATPLSYLKAYDPIRHLFARLPLSRARGYTPGTFSFNVPRGRCEECQGEGFEKVEMQFLSDVYITCPVCGGKRFKDEILEIAYQGKSINGVLEMTAQEAMEFFGDHPQITSALSPLVEVGLGYMKLGQPLNTVSGGEAQRLKLAQHMGRGRASTLFIFDEPTTGLHFDDIRTLLSAFDRLVGEGNTLVVIEHNMDVIKCADYLIDLGPEGGQEGGDVVIAGAPEEVAACESSHTGRFLRRYLKRGQVRVSETTTQQKEKQGEDGGAICITGAREHNLRDLTLTIPREHLVVITGMSGSGKSTLAFDIVFAEGQRRYLECLSSYIRQYLKIMDRPQVDLISGIPPTVAIEQRISQAGKRSTVATITEIYHYLRLLYSKLGVQYCPRCGGEISSHPPEGIAEEILKGYGGSEVTILAPLAMGRKGFHKEVLEGARRAGYMTARIDGMMVHLDPLPSLSRYHEHDIELMVDHREITRGDRSGLLEAVKKGLELGRGTIYLLAPNGREIIFSQRLYCPRCHIGFEELDPRLFSFNSRHGACAGCQGLGSVSDFMDYIVLPDPRRSLEEGALAPFEEGPLRRQKAKVLREIQQRLDIPLDRPLMELGEEIRRKVLHGSDGFQGVIAILRELLRYAEGDGLLDHLFLFMGERECPRCQGRRLKENALAVKVKGWGIWDLVSLSARDAERAFGELRFDGAEMPIAEGITREVAIKLQFLNRVGLSYLTLDRRGDTLSGGEAQRIRLAAQLGSNLRGVCYILDEPTIGLHPRDNQMLLATLGEMRDRGNTILVVEHDEETIRRGDYIIDLGPGGGVHGGRVVAAGTLHDIQACSESITGAYLNGRRRREITSRFRPPKEGQWLWVLGAREHNLKGIDVGIPLGTLSCITGVSGSGKSTLLKETIFCGLRNLLDGTKAAVGTHHEIRGWEYLERVLEVDHSPIGRTPRSTPATYVGLFDEIRRLFSLAPEARTRGYGPGRFSFNVKGGRCEECFGQGKIKVQMQFLPDVYVDCEGCLGRRYNDETLSVTYKGKNIHQILEMTFEEGLEFFSAIPKVRRILQMIVEMGLGYLTFGQPSPTLSGGEAQRVKLVTELSKPSRGKTLYILDEPTTGLHIADIERLLNVLQKLVDRGNTVVVIEHNLEVIKEADYIIDLGPEGGAEGGHIVAQGSPKDIIEQEDKSYTARFLGDYLSQ